MSLEMLSRKPDSEFRRCLQSVSHMVGKVTEDAGRDVGRAGGNGKKITLRDFLEGRVDATDAGALGSPFPLDDKNDDEERFQSVRNYAELLEEEMLRGDRSDELVAAVKELHGETLCCWCQAKHEEEGDLCHALVLAWWAEQLNEL
jgi:hypothetical protein